ncbi:uncharacterized protein [Primulina huaijiensis]|uniref:uncharacterized protein n=1 Tax=Primulina huaijiensis TaxID=1492673 RepID=UPI003CC73008
MNSNGIQDLSSGVVMLIQSIIESQSVPEGYMLMAHAHATQVFQLKNLVLVLVLVLDQTHRQPMSLSLPMVSLPAPESIVDSFPVKTQGKSERSQSEDDVSQCYICLAEYEEGDKIRVLPFQHEYHISCVR